jgi:RNA polymerase primary sigma factor
MEAQRAREVFVSTNQRFVWKLVRETRLPKHLSQDDLYQEGMLGLLRAVDLYQPELGFRFKTYAGWWIEQHIYRAIDNDDRQVRLPVYLQEKLRKIRRAQSKLRLATGEQPDVTTLANATGMDSERLGKLLWRVQATNVVDGDSETEDGTPLFHFIPDEQTPSPLSSVEQQQLSTQLALALESLTPREERVLRLRFGIEQDTPLTLQSVGDQFGVTRERIRQIEAKALRKLKHPSRTRNLRAFLE